MSPLSTTSPADDLSELAGEYVLGTLSGRQRREVEQRLAQEPALQAAVQAWEARLLPLTALVPAVPPSPRLWQRVVRSWMHWKDRPLLCLQATPGLHAIRCGARWHSGEV
ncbi:hypothetical protein [Advenella kashmirensis]|uniref:hypothetical protein n=1 Tax=Advenella kashmirensis TaxID=310575 RepID=UPI0026AA024D